MPDNEDLMIARIARELRKPERVDPSFDARVMAEIRADRAPRLTPWQWMVRPRSIRISPLGGLGLAGALAASMMLALSLDDRGMGGSNASGATGIAAVESVTSPPAVTQPPIQTVQFVLRAPRANSVTVVGDFNDWDAGGTPMQKGAGDLWTVTIPLTAGRYTYTFIVDGKRWVADPSAPRAPADGFGQPSSVVTVGASAS